MRRICIHVFAALFGFKVEYKYKYTVLDEPNQWSFTSNPMIKDGWLYEGKEYVLTEAR